MTSRQITRRLFLKLGRHARQLSPKSVSGYTKSYLPDGDGYTPIQNFFQRRIGFLPQIDTTQWTLRIEGLVEKPLSFDYASLMSEQQVEIAATLLCKDNSASNFLMGNARWSGIPFQDLLDQAQVQPEANYVRFFSADGYITATSLDQLKAAIVAFAMNGEPLTPEHGYPARIILLGQYGQKMPKWIQRIEFTDKADTVETDRVATTAAILSPRPFEPVDRQVTLMGVAYAGNRAISSIEVSVDDGQWMPVPLAEQVPFTWTRWQIDWTAPAPGDYLIRVRAADNSNFAQGFNSTQQTVVVRVVA